MSRVRSVSTATLVVVLFLLVACWTASAQQPSLVMSLHRTVYSNLTKGVSRVAANARGDVFFEDPANAQIVEVPAGTTTPIPLLVQITAGASTTPDGVTVGSDGSVYVAAAYDGRVIRIPFVDGAYPTNINFKDLKAANTLCTTGLQTPCVFPTSSWPAVGYYMQTGDVAVDAAGDVFFVDISDSASGGGTVNRIVELTANGTVNIVANNLPHVTSAQIAADKNGNLYYAQGQASSTSSLSPTYLYYIPAGSVGVTPTPINSTLKNPTGVTFDQAGNLIVSDTGNSRIVVAPLENGTLNFAHLYVLTPQYTQNSVGIDSFGTVYYTGASTGSTSINASHTQIYSAGAIPLLNNSTTYTVQASFNTTATFSGIYTQGNGATVTATLGSCVVGTTYTPTQSCSLNMTITPKMVGPVSGIMGVKTSTGNVLGQFVYSAIGQGSQLTMDPGTATAVGSGYQSPAGVAVDGAGNVFVADTGANTVYELVGGSGTPVPVGVGLNGPTAVAVNYAGDLFIADTGNSRVVRIPNLGGTLSNDSQTTVASGLGAPLAIATGTLNALYIAQPGNLARYDFRGVPTALTTQLSDAIGKPESLAVDAAGNVYVGDSSAGTVIQIAQGTNAATVVASGLTNPTGLAVDPAGDLFLVDSGTAQVQRIPVVNGTLSYTDAVSVGTFNSPLALAIDLAGNLFVSDTSVPGLFEVSRVSGSLNFGNINIGDSSPVLTATLVSSGNLTSGTTPLTLGTPLYSAADGTGDFSINPASTCAAGSTLAPTASCSLAAVFSPTVNGVESKALTINVENMSPLQLTLSGSGRYLATTSISTALTAPTGGLSYGQTATFTATVTASSLNNAPATGLVTFYINGVAQKPISLQSDGTASIQTTALSGGPNTVYATYSGDENYQPSTSSQLTSTVAPAATSSVLTLTTTYVNPVSQQVGVPVTMTAQVTPSVQGVLNGTVKFMSGSTVIGTADLDGSFRAVLTTSSLPAGNYSIVAAFQGSTNYGSSNSTPAALIVSPGSIQMKAQSSSLTTSASSPGSVMLSVSSVAGLDTAKVTFACSGLPSNAVCIFSPQYLTLYKSPASAPQSATAVKMSVLVNVNPGSQPLPALSKAISHSRRSSIVCSLFFGLPLLTLFGSRKRKGQLVIAFFACLLVLAVCLGFTGCGSSSSSQSTITPGGTTPVTVTATGTGTAATKLTATTSLTINVTVAQ